MSASPYREQSPVDSEDEERRSLLPSVESSPAMRLTRVDDDPTRPTSRAADGRRRLENDLPRPQVEPLPELTATGAALAFVTLASLAAILDRMISPGLGMLFGFVFILSSVYTALRMCWRDSWAALALPPLVFVGAAGISSQVSSSATGGWMARTSTDIASAVLGHPVYLLAGTVLAAACMAYRARVE